MKYTPVARMTPEEADKYLQELSDDIEFSACEGYKFIPYLCLCNYARATGRPELADEFWDYAESFYGPDADAEWLVREEFMKGWFEKNHPEFLSEFVEWSVERW